MLYIAVTLICSLICLIADQLTHTAIWHQPRGSLMQDDHFDIFADDDHGSTSDYWDHYTDVLAEAFAITSDETPFLLTDSELDSLSEDIDHIAPGDWDDAIADQTINPPF